MVWHSRVSNSGATSHTVSDWKLNSSTIICLFLVPASLMKIHPKIKALLCSQHFFCAQGQVTPKWLVGSGNNSNSSALLCLSWLPANLMKIQSKMNALACSQHFLHYKSMGTIFVAQGQVTPNMSEVFCLFLLSASLKKVRSKMKALLWSHFQAPNGKLTRIRTHPRFYVCPSYLKVWWRSKQKWRRYRVHNILTIISVWENFHRSIGASKSKANNPICPKIEHVRDFMHVLFTCKIEEGLIKNEGIMIAITFPIVSQWGHLVAVETRVLIQSAPKTLYSLSPTPVMLHIKFFHDWPTDLRGIFNFESVDDATRPTMSAINGM